MTESTQPDRALRYSNIGRLLLFAFDAFERRTVAGIQQRGFPDFSMAHGAALRNIDLEGTRISEVARRAHMTKQGMGQLLQELERRRYVKRGADPRDGRAKLVRLTARGRRLITAGQEVFTQLERDWRRLLGAEAMKHLRRSLRAVADYEVRRSDAVA